ncbi:RHS repeat-associated core domain-containing protein [Thermophagus sp. OGC60D27]|uniref:RHS repeat-associated core domain-containing protein n=1 Tax=Thermophagus sp. OGC60D27 TaxID=3458415 RepID=UPI00403821C6
MTALTDQDGNVVERQAFDPWGNRRDPDDWTSLITTPVSHITGRGYTLHEHLDDFVLINMNGRVYDPQIARFLSPDPQLQVPGYWLNYNRYGYCLNNPLIYTDPSGEFFWAALPLMVKIGIAVGTGVGAYTGYKIGEANGASG